MTITSFAATSRSAILPSGETRDRVIPGMLSVVAWGRTRGVAEPEFCRMGGLQTEALVFVTGQDNRLPIFRSRRTHILGDVGAVDDMLLV